MNTAIRAVFGGAAWQRCRVHFLRNVLASVPKGNAEMVAAAVRTIFAQPDDRTSAPSSTSSPGCSASSSRSSSMLLDAADDLTAFAAFPVGHWKKI